MCRRLPPHVLEAAALSMQAAIDKLERALVLLPEDSDAWYSLGVLLSDQVAAVELCGMPPCHAPWRAP